MTKKSKGNNKISFKHLLISLFFGFILSFVLGLLVGLAANNPPAGVLVLFIFLVVFSYAFYKLYAFRRMLGFLLIGLGLEAWLFPIASFFSVISTKSKLGLDIGEAILAGTFISLIFASVAFIFGLILIVIGYFVQKTKS